VSHIDNGITISRDDIFENYSSVVYGKKEVRIEYKMFILHHNIWNASNGANSIGQGGGAPWVKEQQTINWPNCT